jgi:hypothetical protein
MFRPANWPSSGMMMASSLAETYVGLSFFLTINVLKEMHISLVSAQDLTHDKTNEYCIKVSAQIGSQEVQDGGCEVYFSKPCTLGSSQLQ